MKICVKLETEKAGEISAHHPSIISAANFYNVPFNILRKKIDDPKQEVITRFGKILHIEATDGKTNSTPGPVREYTNSPQENITLGNVALRRGWGGLKQTLGQATSAVQRFFSQFY